MSFNSLRINVTLTQHFVCNFLSVNLYNIIELYGENWKKSLNCIIVTFNSTSSIFPSINLSGTEEIESMRVSRNSAASVLTRTSPTATFR